MKVPPRFLSVPSASVCGLLSLTLPLALRAAEPPSADAEKFLVPYEQVLKALVDDNLNAAKDAAHALPNGAGDKLKNAKDLKAAREAFAELSQTAEKMVAGQPGLPCFLLPDGQEGLGAADDDRRQSLHGQGHADLRRGEEIVGWRLRRRAADAGCGMLWVDAQLYELLSS